MIRTTVFCLMLPSNVGRTHSIRVHWLRCVTMIRNRHQRAGTLQENG